MATDPEELAEVTGVGRLIREQRIQRRMSQPTLGRLAGVTQSTISRIEAGVRFPTWDTVIALLAALDLQPRITAVPLWSDVDSAARRLDGLTLEERCADLEPWLADICDVTAEDVANRLALVGRFKEPVPMAAGGALAAQLLGLPVRARRVELMTGADPAVVRRFLAWATAMKMQPLDPHTATALPFPAEVVDLLTWGCLLASWGGRQCLTRFEPDFGSMPLTWVRVFDGDVPVLAAEALRDTDPWTRRVLRAQQER